MNPYLLASYALKETTTLHVSFRSLPPNNSEVLKSDRNSIEEPINLTGELHISLFEVLKCFFRLEGKQRGKFVHILLQSLWRTYILQIPRQTECDIGVLNITETSYPPSTLHKLKTGN